jgi:hypothetical protein
MRHPLVLALSLAPLACAGTNPAPATPVVVDLTPPAPPPAAAPKPEAPVAEAPPAEAPQGHARPSTPEEEEKAAEFGMIGLLNSGPDATVPWGTNDAVGGLVGGVPGDAFGAGGLGLSGIGPGGGGRGEGIGLGSIGTLGHGAGFGSGHGRLTGSKRSKPPQIRMGAVSVAGRLPPEVIQRIVRQNFGRFRLCYENGLRTKPKLQGKISVRFVIDETGAIASVANAGSDLPEAGVVACVTRAFHGMSFPQPEGGKVTVVYPMTFAPPEDAKPPPSGTAPVTDAGTSPTPLPPPAPPAKKP